MRRVLIAAATVALLTAAGCGGDEEPEAPDTEADDAQSAPAEEQWEPGGELDNMPADAAASLEPPIAPEAISTAFTDAGLAEGEPTDLGAEAEDCDQTDCVRAFTSGEVTVMIYMAEEMAVAAADALGDAHTEGPVVLHYAPTETPEDARADYEAALSEALAA